MRIVDPHYRITRQLKNEPKLPSIAMSTFAHFVKATLSSPMISLTIPLAMANSNHCGMAHTSYNIASPKAPTSWLSLDHFSSRAPGAPFFHIMARYACALSHLSNTCSYLFFYSDIVHFWYLVALCVQVLDQHFSTSLLQVYTQHWHVVSPAVLNLHSQSHPLILAFRIPLSDSAVLTPPFAFLGYCHPVASSPT